MISVTWQLVKRDFVSRNSNPQGHCFFWRLHTLLGNTSQQGEYFTLKPKRGIIQTFTQLHSCVPSLICHENGGGWQLITCLVVCVLRIQFHCALFCLLPSKLQAGPVDMMSPLLDTQFQPRDGELIMPGNATLTSLNLSGQPVTMVRCG